jgi:O-antigen ligase
MRPIYLCCSLSSARRLDIGAAAGEDGRVASRLRSLPHALVGVLTFATAGGLAVADGGRAPVAWGIAAVGLLWLVAAAALFAPRLRLAGLELVTLACLGGLLAWTGLSTLWSVDPEASVRELERGIVGVAGVTALLLLARPAAAVAVLAGLVAAATLTGTVALAAGSPEPIGYANALGLLGAIGAILALGFAVHATRPSVRHVAAVAVAIELATVFISASRGAFAALAIGVVVAAALAGGRRRADVAAAAAAFGVAAFVAAPAPVSGGQPAGPGSPPSSVSITPRLRFWAVAAHSAADAPLRGAGAGSFARTWLERRPMPRRANNAHNLYLETLAELGLPGVLLLAGALGTPLLAAARARGHPLAPAAAGAYAAFLAHAAIDVDWETPVVTVTALGCAGSLLLMARHTEARRRLPRAGTLAFVLVLGAFSAAGLAGNAALEHARVALRAGAYAEVRHDAQAALRFAPWSTEAWRLLGEGASARGDRLAAQEDFAHGIARDPNSWALWRGLAQVSRGAAARGAAARAAALNPLGQR